MYRFYYYYYYVSNSGPSAYKRMILMTNYVMNQVFGDVFFFPVCFSGYKMGRVL